MAHKAQQDFFELVKNKFPEYFTDVKVLDIGSLDINGNTRHFLKQPYYYTGLDLDKGPNVDVVCPAHLYDCGYQFDLIMSGECFEHDMFYPKSLKNLIRLLRPGGLFLFTCASTDRPEHGTLRTSPENAPFSEKYGEEWCNYYKNLTEKDIRDVVDVEDTFSSFYFQESFSGYIGNDLYFWGVKKKVKKVSVLVVNLNNLEYTKNCITDLKNQDCDFDLTIVDQNSSEEGTKEYFSTLSSDIEFIQNSSNVNLNQIWNNFVSKSNTPYICLLNNDVRIAPNFLSSAIEVLEKEPNVGFVNHVSNNSDYQEWSNELNYKIIETPYRQGWDPIFRKECYNQIPDQLSFFYGDDYIYSKLYSSKMKGAYVLNSPMIHFERGTTVEKGGLRDASPDGSFFSQLDLEFKNMSFVEDLSKWKPQFGFIKSN